MTTKLNMSSSSSYENEAAVRTLLREVDGEAEQAVTSDELDTLKKRFVEWWKF